MRMKLAFVAFVLVCVSGVTTLFASGTKEEPAATSAAAAGEQSFRGQTLTVSTWGYNMDLLDKNITRPFEEKYGVKILYETGNNSARLTKLAARKGNPNVDVVHFAGNYTYLAIKDGLLAPYDPAKVRNLKELYDWAKDPLGDRYGVGYAVSSYAIAYRTDKVTTPITSWADLLRPQLKGFVSIPDITTTFGPATLVLLAKAFGGSENNIEPAWQNLPELSKNLVTIYRQSAELTALFQQGEVWVAPYTSFSWGNLQATGVPLKSVIPKEGTVGAQSVVSLVKGAKNVELAYRYIDFLISHEVETAEALDLVDSPTNKTVTVPPDIASKLTYGPQVIDSLIFLNEAKLSAEQEAWVKRWKEIMVK